MTLDKMRELQVNAKAKANWNLRVVADDYRGFSVIPYPYSDRSAGSTPRLAAVRSYSVTGGSGFHTVVLSATKENGAVSFGIWCGDSYLEGKTGSMSRALAVSSQIHQGLGDRDSLIAQLKMANSSVMENGKCNFWPAWKSGKGGCKHVATVLATIGSALEGDLLGLERELLRMLDGAAQVESLRVVDLSPALRWLRSLCEKPVSA